MSEGIYTGLLRCTLRRHAELEAQGRDLEAVYVLWQCVLLRECAEREIDGRPVTPVTALLVRDESGEAMH